MKISFVLITMITLVNVKVLAGAGCNELVQTKLRTGVRLKWRKLVNKTVTPVEIKPFTFNTPSIS